MNKLFLLLMNKLFLPFKFLLIIIVTLSVITCSDNTLTPQSNSTGPDSQLGSVNSQESASDNKFITSDAAAFAKRLKELNNDNEVLIVLKNAAEPRIAKATLNNIPASGIIALAEASARAPQRTSPGFARVNAQSRQNIKTILSNQSVARFTAPDFGNVITATIAEENVKTVIIVLLDNPNVDYIEANESHPVRFNTNPNGNMLSLITPTALFGNPQGSNPSDQKHTFHDVLDAWDFTRGSGARVGILDSGFAYDQGTSSYHPDGQLISSTEGIQKLGFVDDFDSFGNCNGGSGQPYGNCLEWDDEGHGTLMAGLTGANDNSLGYVGIMPDGLTINMKIAQNCYITSGCAIDNTDYEIESDDFYWAIEWARNNNLDALSMSFTGTDQFISTSVFNSLYDAYYTDDILLLSSSGNQGDPSNFDYPETYNFVIGVGGLNTDGTSYGENEHEEISALSGGGTTDTFCSSSVSFCESDGSDFFYAPNGGTSFSTAITAGIVGLVRAYNPTLTAPQVRQRLINTSEGPHNQVNALRAVTNDIPLTVSIDGPQLV